MTYSVRKLIVDRPRRLKAVWHCYPRFVIQITNVMALSRRNPIEFQSMMMNPFIFFFFSLAVHFRKNSDVLSGNLLS